VVDKPTDLAGVDVLFSIVSTGKDLEQVYFGANGVGTANKVPPIFVDCSTIAVEESAEIRKRLSDRKADFVCAPVSGNAKVIKAGGLHIMRGTRGHTELTPQEEAVTSLVAQGLSNREVAAELYVSPKTVQYHLTRIYAKLGIRSRSELAALRR